MRVHSELGPGLLESAYQTCLAYEFSHTGLSFEMEKDLPIVYRGVRLETGYRLDFLVEEKVIIEIKAVRALEPIHKAQLLSYLRLAQQRLGLLINFNVEHLRHGIRRVAN